MLSIGDSALRGVNFIFLVIALGLTGSLAANTITQSNPQVNFAVFAAAFGLLTSSIYGILAFLIEALAWPILLATFDFLNLVFTFAAATAIAAAIRAHSCSNDDYVNDNNVTQGSRERCRKAQASTAFLYFSFFVFLASSFFSIASVIKGNAFTPYGRKSASRVGVTATSQA